MLHMKVVSRFRIATEDDTTHSWTDLGGDFLGIPQTLSYAGLLLAFTRNQNGTVGMCKIAGSEVTWSQWGGTLIAPPGVAPSPNGTLAVVGLMQDSQYQISYVDPVQHTYTAWTTFASGGSAKGWVGTPVLAVDSMQHVEVFSLDSAGTMWRTRQRTTSPPIQWEEWRSLGAPTGTTFSTSALFFASVPLANQGKLQVVALGRDFKMYRTDLGSADRGPASAWTTIGNNSDVFELVNGPAVALSESVGNPAYAAYNQKTGQLHNPLVFAAPPSYPSWGSLNLTQGQYPVVNQAPVMVSNRGIPQLAWLSFNTRGQMMFVSQSNKPGFWNSVVDLGAANSQFTGSMSGFASGGKVLLFQRGADSKLYFINYDPTAGQQPDTR